MSCYILWKQSSVTSIGANAFYCCFGLTDITISNGVTSIGKQAFSEVGLMSVTIPNSVTTIGAYAFSNCSKLASISISDSITTIEDSIFANCSSLESVTIPNGVKSIEQRAFYGCSKITSIIVPNSVTSIAISAFGGCSNLESITLPFVGGSATEDANIGYIFGAVSYSDNAKYTPQTLKHIYLSEMCTSIADNAFYECGITSLVLSSSIVSVGELAFANCYYLKDIYYTGTKEDWNKIEGVSKALSIINSVVHYDYVL